MTYIDIRKTVTFAAPFAMLCTALALPTPTMAHSAVDSVMTVDENRPREEVAYADLDLDSPQGRAQLDARIETAVQHVCGSADIRDLPAYADMRTCRDQSTAQAYAARDTVLAARDRDAHVAVLSVARETIPSGHRAR